MKTDASPIFFAGRKVRGLDTFICRRPFGSDPFDTVPFDTGRMLGYNPPS